MRQTANKKVPQRGSSAAIAEAPLALRKRFDAMRAAYQAERYPTRAMRLSRLQRVESMIDLARDQFAQAIGEDFSSRSRHETMFAEVLVTLTSVRHARRHLRRWMREKRIATTALFWPSRNRLLRQPLGVVGIVSPWNYPLQLALAPAVAALAAGNRVLLKPSELTPKTSALLARLVAENFSADEFSVIEGDADIGRAFCELPFDHLLFTGSTSVGRSVAVAAARNLTPVTLELGGKSPAIVDPSARLPDLLESLMFAKLLNAGQTCIAPDYVLLPRGLEQEFAERARMVVSQMYPALSANPDFSAIVSARHVERIDGLVAAAEQAGARVVTLAEDAAADRATSRRMAPRLVFDVTDQMTLMQEEIFGPVLPVLSYGSIDEAIGYVNRHERPLALYWYGSNSVNRERVLRETVSGGVTVNDALWHIAQENQPFGGVGASGHGAYHGEFGFRTFSHEKSVFMQARWNGSGLMHPPYGRRLDYLLNLMRRIV